MYAILHYAIELGFCHHEIKNGVIGVRGFCGKVSINSIASS
jgi:hypothetical protein